uniref:Uncharacterized protein n=1 Tax=Octopus bimaculoides TaxID=37653 RepID=A0A0L8G8G8_OCTBM
MLYTSHHRHHRTFQPFQISSSLQKIKPCNLGISYVYQVVMALSSSYFTPLTSFYTLSENIFTISNLLLLC